MLVGLRLQRMVNFLKAVQRIGYQEVPQTRQGGVRASFLTIPS